MNWLVTGLKNEIMIVSDRFACGPTGAIYLFRIEQNANETFWREHSLAHGAICKTSWRHGGSSPDFETLQFSPVRRPM